MARPKIDPKVRPALRKSLRRAGMNPGVADAALRSSLPVILERCGGNPLRMWDLAWEVDRWACTRPYGVSDGGAYDLAGALYDFVAAADPTGFTDGAHAHTKGHKWRDRDQWRDRGPTAVPAAAATGTTPARREPATAPLCGCYRCRWEQPHPIGERNRDQ